MKQIFFVLMMAVMCILLCIDTAVLMAIKVRIDLIDAQPVKQQVPVKKPKTPAPTVKWCGDNLLKPGDKVYIRRAFDLLPGMVVANDTVNHVVEYLVRDYYDNRKWDTDHVWLLYCNEHLQRNRP